MPEKNEIGLFLYAVHCFKKLSESEFVLSRSDAFDAYTILSIPGLHIERLGLKALARYLRVRPNLLRLNLSDIDLGNAIFPQIISALHEQSELKYLSLRLTYIEYNSKSGHLLRDFLTAHSKITELDIAFNSLTTKQMKHVLTGIKNNSSLKKVDLSYNHFDKVNFDILASILKSNNKIIQLGLGYADGGSVLPDINKDWGPVFNALNKNKRLKSLDLQHNHLNLEIHGLCKFISMNQTIEKIDLSYNKFTEKELKLLLAALRKNHSLRTLKIQEQGFQTSEFDKTVKRINAELKSRVGDSLTSTDTSSEDSTQTFDPEWMFKDMECPITSEIMKHPVLCTLDGRSYEKTAIKSWLEEKQTSPMSRVKIPQGKTADDVLIPNKALNQFIKQVHQNRTDFSNDEEPKAMACPLSGKTMQHPVLCTLDNKTYEKENIEELLKKPKILFFQKKIPYGKTLDDVLIPDYALQGLIQAYSERNNNSGESLALPGFK